MKTFKQIKNQVELLFQKYSKLITWKDVTLYGEKKMEISIMSKTYSLSISVLDNFTYDYFIIQNEDEKVIVIETKYFTNEADVINEIKENVDVLVNLESKV